MLEFTCSVAQVHMWRLDRMLGTSDVASPSTCRQDAVHGERQERRAGRTIGETRRSNGCGPTEAPSPSAAGAAGSEVSMALCVVRLESWQGLCAHEAHVLDYLVACVV